MISKLLDGAFSNTGSGLPRIHVVTFSLFNSFNAPSHDLGNFQCKFQDKSSVFFQNADVRKIPMHSGKIQSVADDKPIRNLESDVVSEKVSC
jgi:hypothetical protein